jgi:hypothetical protein
VEGELPAQQRAALGGRVTVGQLEIQPLRIEKRPLVIKIDNIQPVGNLPPQQTKEPALVLSLSIKNTSSDLTLHPMDPAFTRKANPYKNDYPITRLVVNKQTFFAGGAIEWPIVSSTVKRRFETQQANDTIPLKPGETHEYVVFTDAKTDILKAVETSRDVMQWRVEVRRAPVEVNGKEVPVTAIIGVDFRATDVKIPELKPAE